MPTQDSTSLATLLGSFRLSEQVTLSNRVLMAPLTRSMSGPGLVPTDAMAKYYARRAKSGLIISEATIVRADGQGYPDTPGIFTEEQITGWKHVTDAVHEAGGKMFLQLWHVGRVSHPTFLNGELTIAPSAVPLEGTLPRERDLHYGTPRAVEVGEISALVEAYAQGAANALQAGFDGVEIHGANGYLIDQFLHYHTNRRTDDYGGSAESMIRFPLEVVRAVIERIGAGRTGLRLSPGAYFNMQSDARDTEVFKRLLDELLPLDLAYVHTGIFDDSTQFEELGGGAGDFLRKYYKGTLVGNGSYDLAGAVAGVNGGSFDLISIGRPFIANPDLMDRIEKGEEWRAYDAEMLTRID